MIVASRCPGVTRIQYRCSECGCNVNPQNHPSTDCADAKVQRQESRDE